MGGWREGQGNGEALSAVVYTSVATFLCYKYSTHVFLSINWEIAKVFEKVSVAKLIIA